MAKRITELTSATVLAETDLLPVVDISDTTQATSGTTKKSTLSLIADYLKARVETLTNKTLTSPTITTPTITTPLIDGARGLSSICHLYKSATQSIGNSSTVAITFGDSDYELYDPLGYHSVSTNTERITIGVAGLYLVYGFVQMADNTTNTARFAALNKNGTDFCMSRMATDGGGRWGATLTSPVVCAENDYITLTMFQITGGDLNLTKASLGVLRI